MKVLNARHLDTIPPQAVYIGRPHPKFPGVSGRWGNPFVEGRDGDRPTVIAKFRSYLEANPQLVAAARRAMAGKDLVCWCAPEPCHGDVWMEFLLPFHPWVAWTDGACQVHTSRCGGVGVVLRSPEQTEETSSFHTCRTTNNRMELEAVIEALDMTPPGSEVLVYTDSMYVVGGFSLGWKIRENMDVWGRLRLVSAERIVQTVHIPRCSTPEHKQADHLANRISKEHPQGA